MSYELKKLKRKALVEWCQDSRLENQTMQDHLERILELIEEKRILNYHDLCKYMHFQKADIAWPPLHRMLLRTASTLDFDNLTFDVDSELPEPQDRECDLPPVFNPTAP